ncbi:MAG: DinB family protein, partial [Dongiaceae bacterium]
MTALPQIGTIPYPLLARFNRWCNRRFFEWAAGLTEEERRLDRGAFFGSIHNTLDHVLTVDRLWLDRIDGQANSTTSFKIVQIEDFERLRIERASEDERIIRMVERAVLDNASERVISYRYMSGQEAESSMHVIFLTLFNHHAHHRGQVHC